MDISIGVFAVRDKAEAAVQELVAHGVPQDSIVYLTRSETEAKESAKSIGSTVGGFAGGAFGMTAGVVTATLLLPGIGPIFALGFGAAALLGLGGAGAGGAVGKALIDESTSPSPTDEKACQEDAEFFREALREGRSIVVVRSESKAVAATASGILDKMGVSIHGRTPVPMTTSTRVVEDITIVDIRGRITLGEGNVILRDLVRKLLESGSGKILLNLHEVSYVDSSGLGELVKVHTTVRNRGGRLKLVSLSKRVDDLMHVTMLHTAFDIQPDEATAIQSFSVPGKSSAVA